MKSQVLLYTSCEGGRVGCGCGCGGNVGKLSSRTETRQLIPQLLSTCHMSIWSDWLPNRSALLDGLHSVNCVCAKQKTEGKNPANKRLSNEETKGAYTRLDRGRLRRVLSTRPRESGAWLTGSNSHSKPLTVSLVSITLKKPPVQFTLPSVSLLRASASLALVKTGDCSWTVSGFSAGRGRLTEHYTLPRLKPSSGRGHMTLFGDAFQYHHRGTSDMTRPNLPGCPSPTDSDVKRKQSSSESELLRRPFSWPFILPGSGSQSS